MKCCITACVDKSVLFLSGILFAVVAVVHLYRFIYTFPIVVGYLVVPHSWSLAGFIIPGLLSIWQFVMAFRCCSDTGQCNIDDQDSSAKKKPRKPAK